MEAVTLDLSPFTQLTDDQFFELCQLHGDYRFERNASGEIIIMSPTGGETGKSNSDLNFQLSLWNRQAQLGVVFDSSTGFQLPNGADRSPDAAWVSQARWDALTPEQKQKFPALCPDFAIELRSASDSLPKLQAKMQEYIENGLQLGWLIDRQNKRVEIYRLGQPVEVLHAPAKLSGELVLPGFILELASIW
jgi:Uma2 family endonuclease